MGALGKINTSDDPHPQDDNDPGEPVRISNSCDLLILTATAGDVSNMIFLPFSHAALSRKRGCWGIK
jgi:hypothetical protein